MSVFIRAAYQAYQALCHYFVSAKTQKVVQRTEEARSKEHPRHQDLKDASDII